MQFDIHGLPKVLRKLQKKMHMIAFHDAFMRMIIACLTVLGELQQKMHMIIS